MVYTRIRSCHFNLLAALFVCIFEERFSNTDNWCVGDSNLDHTLMFLVEANFVSCHPWKKKVFFSVTSLLFWRTTRLWCSLLVRTIYKGESSNWRIPSHGFEIDLTATIEVSSRVSNAIRICISSTWMSHNIWLCKIETNYHWTITKFLEVQKERALMI